MRTCGISILRCALGRARPEPQPLDEKSPPRRSVGRRKKPRKRRCEKRRSIVLWQRDSGGADRPRAPGHKSGKTESSQAPATDPQRIDAGAKMTKCQIRRKIAAVTTSADAPTL